MVAARVYGTPWHGEAALSANAEGTLAGIYFLKQAGVDRRVPIPVSQAASRLFATCFVAGWPRAEGLQFVLDTCVEIASAVPCCVLEFTPSARALVGAGIRPT